MINNILLQETAAAPAVHEAAKAFGATDPYGIVMAVIAMGVVFTSLILLYVIFKNVSKLYGREGKKKKAAAAELIGVSTDDEISGEVNAAIALALHLYHSELHDIEDPIITMKRVARTYSPWSSKIYGITQAPR
jgi:Na+-transporting methylmalonyl-CoA/oxaloacetate decarboxylase gamma subunit